MVNLMEKERTRETVKSLARHWLRIAEVLRKKPNTLLCPACREAIDCQSCLMMKLKGVTCRENKLLLAYNDAMMRRDIEEAIKYAEAIAKDLIDTARERQVI